MEKGCEEKHMMFNPKTRRCYKSCDQRNKDEHPVTKKCRAKCKPVKVRRVEDFRCVSINHKIRTRKNRTKKVTTPVEPLIPPPLEKKLVKNFGLLNKFLQKGRGVAYIDYKPVMRVSDVITIYFFKKYKQACPMYPIQDVINGIKKELKEYSKGKTKEQIKLFEDVLERWRINPESDYWNQTKFLTNLKLCLETGEQLIIVPINLPDHLNMLFIKVATREIIRFEPHGYRFNGVNNANETESETNNFLKNLINDINVHFNLTGDKKFTYKPPSDICPKYPPGMPSTFYRGFQSMEGAQKPHNVIKESMGFCQLWSWFFAECVLSNPEMDIKDVYKEAWDIVNKDEGNFATIIRGYFLSINEELVKMNETFSIHKNNIDSYQPSQTHNIFLRYLYEARTNLNTKPRKTFLGGTKNKLQKPKFIVPLPNSRVTPISL